MDKLKKLLEMLEYHALWGDFGSGGQTDADEWVELLKQAIAELEEAEKKRVTFTVRFDAPGAAGPGFFNVVEL